MCVSDVNAGDIGECHHSHHVGRKLAGTASGSATFATSVAVNVAAAVVVGLFAIAVTTSTSRP